MSLSVLVLLLFSWWMKKMRHFLWSVVLVYVMHTPKTDQSSQMKERILATAWKTNTGWIPFLGVTFFFFFLNLENNQISNLCLTLVQMFRTDENQVLENNGAFIGSIHTTSVLDLLRVSPQWFIRTFASLSHSGTDHYCRSTACLMKIHQTKELSEQFQAVFLWNLLGFLFFRKQIISVKN